ncbi:hypothetical protein ACFOG5_13595 [Pedobacter fastidiosus]|uniref:hypothetical protein n=1 Tax=Pedobacter fastidiosus TaxID=2765361 RepID=UPI00360B3C6E
MSCRDVCWVEKKYDGFYVPKDHLLSVIFNNEVISNVPNGTKIFLSIGFTQQLFLGTAWLSA